MSNESFSSAQERAIRAWLVGEDISSQLLNQRGAGEEQDVPELLLEEGDHVHVQGEDTTLVGTVDCVMPDGSIFWIWQDAGAGRIAIHEPDNLTVTFI
jgi:hypothetical protein